MGMVDVWVVLGWCGVVWGWFGSLVWLVKVWCGEVWAGTRVGMVLSQEEVGLALPSSNMFDDLLLRIKP